MYLPELNPLKTTAKTIDSFGGINRGRVCEENQFYNTEFLSSRNYPALSSAEAVYELDSIETNSVGMPVFFLNGKLGYIDPYRSDLPGVYSLIYNGSTLTNFELSENVTGANVTAFNGKTLFVKGTMAYEFDPSYTSPATALSNIGYTLTVQPAHENPTYNEATLRLSLLYEDMTEFGSFSKGTEDQEFPEDAEVDDCFARRLECYRLIYKDSTDSSNNIWQPVTSFRLRLNIGDGYRRFKEGDYVRLKGLKYWNWAVRHFKELERFVRIDAVDEENRFITDAIPIFEDFCIIAEAMEYPTNNIGYGNPIINNAGNDLYMLEGSISGCMPSIDFVCTGANRVWGCSNDNREIYASELGNARNWSVFEGLSGDSYAVTVGSDGDFTACCNYLGTPVFFKENEMIVITGSRPASFTLNSYSVRGVPKDSPNGLCVVGDTLYYIAHDGVYAYNGSGAVCISKELGEDIKRLTDAVFGGEGDMLYISGNIDGAYMQFTYDTLRKIWHNSSSEQISGYIKYPDASLCICYDNGIASVRTLGEGIPRDYELSGAKRLDNRWCWETGDITYRTTDKKYVRKICLDTECDGVCDMYISYDGGVFRQIGHFAPHKRGASSVYVFPMRCDSFRLRMSGEGEMTLYALTKEVEEAKENG